MVREVADYRNRLEQLEEFRIKRGVWIDQEEAHKKQFREMKEDYESQMARLNEMQKNNELRWAEDIRRQKAAMEEKVRKEIERETSAENERMWKEHAQMRIDLKHQKALMQNYMAQGRKWKEEREKLEGELVVATSVQAAVMRKVKFVTKRLKISDKLVQLLKEKGWNKFQEDRGRGGLISEEEGDEEEEEKTTIKAAVEFLYSYDSSVKQAEFAFKQGEAGGGGGGKREREWRLS